MSNSLIINDKIGRFKKVISVSGDKSLSIRWVLVSSLANGVSNAKNLLLSDDVLAALKAIKILGIKSKITKNGIKIFGKGIKGYNYKKNITIDAENSGTLGRLILGLLINTTYPIKLIGDKSLSKRDFRRVTNPLSKFGAKFKLNKGKNLPLTIFGSQKLSSIKYIEKKGSAQCKSSVIFGGIRTNGTTVIKAKKSRNHTEVLFQHLNLPIKVKSKKSHDEIKIKKVKIIKPLNYNIPSDISSSAFFIVLTALSNSSELIIKNVNINPSRTGIITILKKMGVSIIFKNKKIYKGEQIANICVKSTNKINAINCPTKLNSSAIDEFLIIFLVAARAKGVSYFKNLEELNQKESQRLNWGSKILNMMGVKTELTNHSIKIYGNPNLNLYKNYEVKNYLKDHRIMAMTTIAALTLGGKWKIHDPDSINTSFPSFLKIIKNLGGKIN